MSKLLFVCTSLSLLLNSCGYRPGLGNALGTSSSVSVPYVCGDRDGTFTAELIRQLAISGGMQYKDCDAERILTVRLLDRENESIGYRYETDQFGNVGRRLVASEERSVLFAEVCLTEAKSGRILLGPVCLKASVTFDFAPETSAEAFGFPLPTQTITRFSLGQLDFREAAIENATIPLYCCLAKEIVDYINETW